MAGRFPEESQMTISVYQKAESVLCEMVFKNDAGLPADPATVVFRLTHPDGTEISFSSGDAQLLHPSAGLYRVSVMPLGVAAGRNTAYFSFSGSGNGIEIKERGQFKI